jgi:hypothetical protein
VDGVARPAASDPVLAPSDLAGLLVCAARAIHQPSMGFIQEADRQRQAVHLRELAPREAQGLEVVADLLHIGVRRGVMRRLEGQQIDERRLGALDL